MQRAQCEPSNSKRAQQAAALQQLRARKGGQRQHFSTGDENSSAVANMQSAAGDADRAAPAHGCAWSACLEDSDSGEDAQQQHALASTHNSAPQPLRRLRRLAAPGAVTAQAEAAGQAAAVGELANSLSGLSVASAVGCRPGTATPHTAVTGECSETPVSVSSSSQHSQAGGARQGAARSAGLGADTRLPLGSVDSARCEAAASSGQLSPAAGARLQSSPGDLVLGERSEYVLPSRVASKLYSHQVIQVLLLFSSSLARPSLLFPAGYPGRSDLALRLAQVEGVRWLFKLHALQSGGILGDPFYQKCILLPPSPMHLVCRGHSLSQTNAVLIGSTSSRGRHGPGEDHAMRCLPRGAVPQPADQVLACLACYRLAACAETKNYVLTAISSC